MRQRSGISKVENPAPSVVPIVPEGVGLRQWSSRFVGAAAGLRARVRVGGKWVDSFEGFGFVKMMRPAKRRRALLESNPLRNSRRELIAWPDGKFARTLRPAVFLRAT